MWAGYMVVITTNHLMEEMQLTFFWFNMVLHFFRPQLKITYFEREMPPLHGFP